MTPTDDVPVCVSDAMCGKGDNNKTSTCIKPSNSDNADANQKKVYALWDEFRINPPGQGAFTSVIYANMRIVTNFLLETNSLGNYDPIMNTQYAKMGVCLESPLTVSDYLNEYKSFVEGFGFGSKYTNAIAFVAIPLVAIFLLNFLLTPKRR
jgi:hypothetical protein